MNKLGRTIRILRLAKELNVSELAKKSGVSTAYLSMLEKGERTPSVDVLQKLSSAFNIPSDTLVLMALEAGSSIKSEDSLTRILQSQISDLMDIEIKLKKTLSRD